VTASARIQTHTKGAHERYPFKPLRGSSHSWALAQLKGRVEGKRVLDVGAGSGWLGAAVRSEAPSALIAIEIDQLAHPSLSGIYDCVHTDPSSLMGQQFDFIVLLDVLEHVPEPLLFLLELRRTLAPGGLMLISVPNVAHWSVRLPLFFWGSFEYQNLGIMDRTHLQFFSRKSFRRLCGSLCDCTLQSLSASIEPFELALPQWVSRSRVYTSLIPLRLLVARKLPGLMAYQHLAIIEAPASGT
jgi:SAM-dependent methyltransferase